MQWPNFFPKNCPPNNANHANGVFYRLIDEKKQKQLTRKYFRSHREKQPKRIWPNTCECCLCSTSVIADYDDVLKQRTILINRVPGKSKGWLIARGTINVSHGKILHSPDKTNGIESHYDWWIPKDIDPSPFFEYYNIENEE